MLHPGEWDYLGTALDEVLEGCDEVPIIEPADRESQVVNVPELTPRERDQALIDHQKFIDENLRRSPNGKIWIVEYRKKLARDRVLWPNKPHLGTT